MKHTNGDGYWKVGTYFDVAYSWRTDLPQNLRYRCILVDGSVCSSEHWSRTSQHTDPGTFVEDKHDSMDNPDEWHTRDDSLVVLQAYQPNRYTWHDRYSGYIRHLVHMGWVGRDSVVVLDRQLNLWKIKLNNYFEIIFFKLITFRRALFERIANVISWAVADRIMIDHFANCIESTGTFARV